MKEHDVEGTLDRLIQQGIVEQEGHEIHPSRRWNAKLQAAAEKINQIAAVTGVNPEGNPLALAVSQALANENLGWQGDDFDAAVRVLVMLELSRMPAHKRAQLGFADVEF